MQKLKDITCLLPMLVPGTAMEKAEKHLSVTLSCFISCPFTLGLCFNTGIPTQPSFPFPSSFR